MKKLRFFAFIEKKTGLHVRHYYQLSKRTVIFIREKAPRKVRYFYGLNKPFWLPPSTSIYQIGRYLIQIILRVEKMKSHYSNFSFFYFEMGEG